MPMRILAVVAEARGARACLSAALAAAAVDPKATIEAFHVKVDPRRLMASPEEVATQRLRVAYEGTADERAAAVEREYQEWLAERTSAERPRFSFREVVGAEAEKVVAEARTTDLLVLSRPHDMDAHDALHAAIFQVHRPLLVPSDWPDGGPRTLGERIVIAWVPTEQARRAVLDAGPWLRKAKRVILLAIVRRGRDPAIDDGEHLLREAGATFETVRRDHQGREPGVQLVETFRELGGDMLVMGAYRHNDWVEWALGGTTRYVLAHADFPLLLAH